MGSADLAGPFLLFSALAPQVEQKTLQLFRRAIQVASAPEAPGVGASARPCILQTTQAPTSLGCQSCQGPKLELPDDAKH